MYYYIKRTGLREYYKISGSVRLSKRNNRIFTVTSVEKVSEYHWLKYAAPCYYGIQIPEVGDEFSEWYTYYLPWYQKENTV